MKNANCQSCGRSLAGRERVTREFCDANCRKEAWADRTLRAARIEFPDGTRETLASTLDRVTHQRLQAAAHCLVQRAVARGELQRPEACSGCGRKGYVEAHHEDYFLPLTVTWLCRGCHRVEHNRLRMSRNPVAEMSRRRASSKRAANSRRRMQGARDARIGQAVEAGSMIRTDDARALSSDPRPCRARGAQAPA